MLLYLVIEIVALVALGSAIGLGWTLLVLLAGSVVGLWLARREGVRAAQALADAVNNRRVPTAELTDGVHTARVEEDIRSGRAAGVAGTPAFFVNGVRHDGGYDAQSLIAALESSSPR